MPISSETILNLLIWAMTGAGLFFGGRAAWRRRHLKTLQSNPQRATPGSKESLQQPP